MSPPPRPPARVLKKYSVPSCVTEGDKSNPSELTAAPRCEGAPPSRPPRARLPRCRNRVAKPSSPAARTRNISSSRRARRMDRHSSEPPRKLSDLGLAPTAVAEGRIEDRIERLVIIKFREESVRPSGLIEAVPSPSAVEMTPSPINTGSVFAMASNTNNVAAASIST